jgi:hypothetical protein
VNVEVVEKPLFVGAFCQLHLLEEPREEVDVAMSGGVCPSDSRRPIYMILGERDSGLEARSGDAQNHQEQVDGAMTSTPGNASFVATAKSTTRLSSSS